MGKPRRGISLLLETCRPFPSITAAKNLFLYSVSCEINGYREQRSLCSGAVEIHRIKLCHARPHEETGTAHNPKSRRGASTRDLQRMSSYRIRYWFKAW